MLCAKRSVLGHVSSRLAHKPHRRAIDRFPTAGFEKTIIHKPRILAGWGRSAHYRECADFTLIRWTGTTRIIVQVDRNA